MRSLNKVSSLRFSEGKGQKSSYGKGNDRGEKRKKGVSFPLSCSCSRGVRAGGS